MYRMDTKVFSGRSAGLESRDSLRTSHQLAIDIALAAAHLPGGRFKCPQPRAIDAYGWYTGQIRPSSGEPVEKSKLIIVVHYHELWLKGGNRRFFLSKLHMALKRALEGLPVERILRPGDRLLVEFGEGASAEEAVARIERVFGVAFYAVARVVPRGGDDNLRRWGGRPGKKFAARNLKRSRCAPNAATNLFRRVRSTLTFLSASIWWINCAPVAATLA